MALTFSFQGAPSVEQRRCDSCGDEHDLARGLVLGDGHAYASYFAAWHPHAAQAWVDVTLGSWTEPGYEDNVTFGCRILMGASGAVCTLVLAGETLSDSRLLGRKLTRDEALQHAWLDAFWEVLDWLILNDPTLHEHVYHMGAPPASSPGGGQ